MENIAPFYVGQRVVAIEDHSIGRFKRGATFTVKNIKPGCCDWEVDVGIRTHCITSVCPICGLDEMVNGIGWYFSRCFAPISESFQAITYEKVIEENLISVN